mgnify:CR=1 FL=1
MLSLQHVTKEFKIKDARHPVLQDINFTVEANSIVSLLGPNGCGKTTLLKILAGLEQPTSGTISWSNTQHPRVGFLFQNPAKALFPWQTVEEHIRFALKTHVSDAQELQRESHKILDALQMSTHKNKYPYELSGGMMQLLAMGRSWAMRPDIFILDEALSALDYYSALALQDIFLKLWSERPIPTVVVTHDVDEAIFLSDKICILSPRPGRIIEEIDVALPRPRQFADRTSGTFVELRKRVLDGMEGFLI